MSVDKINDQKLTHDEEHTEKGAFVSVLLVGGVIAILYVIIFWVFMARV